MREISINLGPSIDQADIEIVKAAMSKMAAGDHLVLNLEAADAHETDRILEILRAADMDFQTHGSHSGQAFYIIATPREKNSS